jgi:hypothetical protein
MRKLVAAALFFALCGASFAADDISGFFLRPQEVAGWVPTAQVETYPGAKIYDFIDGAGEIYMKYNFEIAASAEYAGPGGAAISVEIYEMRTPEDAYGVFAYNRPANAEPLQLTQAAYASGITAGVWRDTYYVKVYGLEEKPGVAGAVKEFARLVSLKIPGQGNLPQLFKVVEVDGFVKGSVRFLRSDLPLKNLHFVSDENVLNLNENTQMVLADYSFKDRRFTAFVAAYPTAEDAAAAASKYAKFLGAHPDAEAAWFKQSGKAIVGVWAGMKVAETQDSQDVMNDTIKNVLEQVKTYQLQK